jgi:phosphoribosylformylglycinamidine (FGAM) synthase PurS component
VEELRRLNLEVEATNSDLLEWARDEVTMEEVKELSQEHLGEQIIEDYDTRRDPATL